MIPRGADVSSRINHWKHYLRASNLSEESGSVSKVDPQGSRGCVCLCVCSTAGDHLPCCCLSPSSYIRSCRPCWVLWVLSRLPHQLFSSLGTQSPVSFGVTVQHSMPAGGLLCGGHTVSELGEMTAFKYRSGGVMSDKFPKRRLVPSAFPLARLLFW